MAESNKKNRDELEKEARDLGIVNATGLTDEELRTEIEAKRDEEQSTPGQKPPTATR